MKSTNKHTPGPWCIEYTTNGYTVIRPSKGAGGPKTICRSPQGRFYKAEQKANRSLILCAPELMSMLETVYDAINDQTFDRADADKLSKSISKVLAKAEGR